jgi:hypothetical protein
MVTVNPQLTLDERMEPRDHTNSIFPEGKKEVLIFAMPIIGDIKLIKSVWDHYKAIRKTDGSDKAYLGVQLGLSSCMISSKWAIYYGIYLAAKLIEEVI